MSREARFVNFALSFCKPVFIAVIKRSSSYIEARAKAGYSFPQLNGPFVPRSFNVLLTAYSYVFCAPFICYQYLRTFNGGKREVNDFNLFDCRLCCL